MTDDDRPPDADEVAARAYDAFEHGDLTQAAAYFEALLALAPEVANYHYMQGLTCKYLRDWQASLRHNLRAEALRSDTDLATAWNAGIAATALGDWAQARRQWALCGVDLSAGEGPIMENFGVIAVRLNPWGDGETLYARRMDPARARLLNVPLPDSGYRYGDVVLHDGAKAGSRPIGDQRVPVFNVLDRIEASDFATYAVFVGCDSPDDIEALTHARAPGLGHVEDWTDTLSHYCLRCSYGTAHHLHADKDDFEWHSDRNLGIAAQSRATVDAVLQQWLAGGRGRWVDAVEQRDAALPTPPQGVVWWRSPDDAD